MCTTYFALCALVLRIYTVVFRPTSSEVSCTRTSTCTDCRAIDELPNDIPDEAEHLVIDAEHAGNVSRFFNHSCNANIACQTVLLPGAGSALLYGAAFFAQEDIPAMTELRWDYNAGLSGDAPEGSVPCLCGSATCRTWLY